MLSKEEQLALIEQARSDDPRGCNRAVRRLLDDFRGPTLASVHKTLASLGVSGEHAEDVFQAASAKFSTYGVASFRGDSAPRTYFVRIAVNCAIELGRRQHRRRQRDALLTVAAATGQLPAGPGRDPERACLRAEHVVALRRCLERLSPGQRRSVELFYLEERGDCACCGEALGTGRAAFQKRISRARQDLLLCIKGQLSGEEAP